MRKALQVFNLNEKLKDYNQWWKERSLGKNVSFQTGQTSLKVQTYRTPVSYTHLLFKELLSHKKLVVKSILVVMIQYHSPIHDGTT